MSKLRRAGARNLRPAAYYMRAGGLRILDETNRIERFAKNGQVEVELLRPLEFEIVRKEDALAHTAPTIEGDDLREVILKEEATINEAIASFALMVHFSFTTETNIQLDSTS